MKRVGELYEVVVFTASVSKVCRAMVCWRRKANESSTVTHSSISLISTVSCTTDFSVKVATTTKETMSR